MAGQDRVRFRACGGVVLVEAIARLPRLGQIFALEYERRRELVREGDELGHTGIGSLPIVYFGTQEQKQRFLPKCATGEGISSLWPSEAPSDALNAKPIASLSPEGPRRVPKGEEMWLTNAGFADVDINVEVGGEQFSCFPIERDMPGVSPGAEEGKAGIKGSSTRPLIPQGATLPKRNLLDEISEGQLTKQEILALIGNRPPGGDYVAIVSGLLVTGATGFVGRAVLKALRDSRRAPADIHLTARGAGLGGEVGLWHRIDLLDAAAVTSLLEQVRPTQVLHLAWCSEHGRFWDSPQNLAWVGATLHLFAESARLGGTRFVAVGTCAEYEPGPGPCDERVAALRPMGLYGAAKAATGLCVEAAGRSFGISSAWPRLFFPYGPGDQAGRLIPSVVRALRSGSRIAVTIGHQLRDPLYVTDVADALLAVLDSPVQGAINVASGNGVAVRDLIERLAGKSGRAGLVDWGGREADERGTASWVASIDRLRDEVGWRARIPLDEGLQKLLDSDFE